MRIALATPVLAMTVGACAGTPAPAPIAAVEATATCDAEAAQYHIGHTASAQMGQAMLADSGARTLRWLPPRSAMTMDYRPDRLTVSYDDDMRITQVSCT